MHDELLARQEPLGLVIPPKVAVIGCGGVGSWVAYFLAMAGVPELWLFDHDHVSEHNRNRLPVPPQAVGQLKSEALRDIIAAVRPDCRIYAMAGFTPELADQIDLSEVVYIVATTDTLLSRKTVAEWAADASVNYLEAAAEGEVGSITGVTAEWATEAETQPGYASVPVWVGSAVLAATMACYYILHGCVPHDHSYRMGWDAENFCIGFNHHDPYDPEAEADGYLLQQDDVDPVEEAYADEVAAATEETLQEDGNGV